MLKKIMTLETLIDQCAPEVRDFLKYVYRRNGPYITGQVLAELVHRVGIKRAEDLLINGRGKSSVSGQWDKEEIIQ